MIIYKTNLTDFRVDTLFLNEHSQLKRTSVMTLISFF